MNTRYKIVVGFCLVALLLGYKFFTGYADNSTVPPRYTIGIIQTASHPALDASCKGFTDYLSNVFGNDIQYSIKNIQGDCAQAYSVAKSFNHGSVDAVFAVATLAAQTAVQTKTDKPIVLAAVTDPERNGLWIKGDLMCGAPDTIDIERQYELIKILLPNIKKIGLLYSLYEPNSQFLVNGMQKTLQAHNIGFQIYGVSQASDLPLVIAQIANVDVVWIPTDNGIAAALDNVIQLLNQKDIPLIISDNLLMRTGVLAAIGVDYYQCGQQAGKCLEIVLSEHINPGDIALSLPVMSKALISRSLLMQYNQTIDTNTLTEHIIINQ